MGSLAGIQEKVSRFCLPFPKTNSQYSTYFIKPNFIFVKPFSHENRLPVGKFTERCFNSARFNIIKAGKKKTDTRKNKITQSRKLYMKAPRLF